MKLTINTKLLLSYLAMALLTVVASAYAFISLQNLNKLAYAIITHDFIVLDTSKKMIDTLLAQESVEKKYLILKDPSLAAIFWTRSREFKESLKALEKNRIGGQEKTLSRVSLLHERYGNIFSREISLIQENLTEEANTLSENSGKKNIEAIASSLHAIERNAQKSIDTRMNLIKAQSIEASRITVILSSVSLIVGFSLALLITYNIARPLRKLERATALIAEGQFDHSFNMNHPDAIGSLARAFLIMGERLKALEVLNLDASPLTGLPGNMAIEREIERRLSEKIVFSLCHVDLDNFKPFADKYGYAWGSEVIKEVADILMSHRGTSGQDQEDAFIGHIGGDDFVIISEPGRAEHLSRQLIADFDRRILKFYREEDRLNGFIMGRDRRGTQQKFPLITLTVAIVTDDGRRFKSPLEMAMAAAELKEYAKELPGSNCVKQEDIDKENRDT
ncbi:MAG: diguanylate cyclase [Syntrophales bacterium]|nr:diguanylate cyclase [Syntrophales bacterium]